MIKAHEREKLLNAIIYFAEHTKYCGKTKLFKLLFLLDFEHFKLTGRSVTGSQYRAIQLGPVPSGCFAEFDAPEEDFLEAIEIKPSRMIDYSMLKIVPRRGFDPSHFSKRELRLMETIATEHKNKTATQMVDLTHAENGVWDRVFAKGEGAYNLIPYTLALDDENAAAVIEKAKEYEALRVHYAD